MLRQELANATAEGHPRAQGLALAAVTGSVLTWGCSNVVIKLVSTTGLVACFYRLWFAIPLLWLLPLTIPSMRRRLHGRWRSAALVGGSLFAVHQIFFFNSLKLTSVANVAIIGALQPVLVLLVARPLFAERVTRNALGWSVVAVCGTILVVLGSAGTPHWSPLGDALAVANLFSFTAYFLATKRLRTGVGAAEYLLGVTTVSGLLILVVVLITGQQLSSPRASDWPLLLFLAVFPGSLGHFLTNWAMPRLAAFLISVILLAVPVISTVGAALFLHEPLTVLHVIGGTMVLLAIGIIVHSSPPTAGEELAESAAETDAP